MKNLAQNNEDIDGDQKPDELEAHGELDGTENPEELDHSLENGKEYAYKGKALSDVNEKKKTAKGDAYKGNSIPDSNSMNFDS